MKGAVAAVGGVKGIGKAHVDGQIVVGVRVHQLWRDGIETFGGLIVALVPLRPELARPAADRVELEKLETAGGGLLPDFELRFLLEDADQNRRKLWHLFLRQQRQQRGRQFARRFLRQRRRCFLGYGSTLGKAADRRQNAAHSRQDREQDHKRADERGADQLHTFHRRIFSDPSSVARMERQRNPGLSVIASKAKQSSPAAKTGLLRRGACHRAGHFGPDPLAPRNDDYFVMAGLVPAIHALVLKAYK